MISKFEPAHEVLILIALATSGFTHIKENKLSCSTTILRFTSESLYFSRVAFGKKTYSNVLEGWVK